MKSKDDKTKKDGSSNSDKKGDETPDLSSQQAVAVLGIGLIAMGEEIGSQMSLRMFGHLVGIKVFLLNFDGARFA